MAANEDQSGDIEFEFQDDSDEDENSKSSGPGTFSDETIAIWTTLVLKEGLARAQ